jgi:protein-S-isoprenylcysteine O-methyltransferase Ste14
MALWSLVLYALYLTLAFGGRALLQLRRTGSTGFVGIAGHRGSVEWTAGILFVAASVLVPATPVLDLAGVLEPIAALEGSMGHALGFLLFCAGLVGTLLAQVWMGASWRVGVDEEEKTELVVRGPFALVRNPIFSAMVPAILACVLTLLAVERCGTLWASA